MILTRTSSVDYLYIPRSCRTRIWHHWSILLQTSHPLGSYTDLWAEKPVITKIFGINDPKGTLLIWGVLWTLENILYYIILLTIWTSIHCDQCQQQIRPCVLHQKLKKLSFCLDLEHTCTCFPLNCMSRENSCNKSTKKHTHLILVKTLIYCQN